jgi:hypothetical protein
MEQLAFSDPKLLTIKQLAEIKKAQAEAKIAENKAEKLTSDDHVDELLEALINPPVKGDDADASI